MFLVFLDALTGQWRGWIAKGKNYAPSEG
jgi:hypothetical protein